MSTYPRQPNGPCPASVAVRLRTDTDLASCTSIIQDVYAEDGYPIEGPAIAPDFLSPPTLLQAWIAEVNGKVTGHVAVTGPSSESLEVGLWLQKQRQAGKSTEAGNGTGVATLGRLFVGPASRGLGIGTSLIGAAVEWCKGQGLGLVLLVLEKDRDAIRMYGRLGWLEYGSVMYRYDGDKEARAFCFVSPLIDII